MSIPSQVIKETEERFRSRTEERRETKEKLATGSKLQADHPLRVEKRLKRLLSGGLTPETVALGAPAVPAAAGATVGTEPMALERILGRSNLISINYLEQGVRVSRSVGRVRIRSASGQTLGFGTGFMVSPRLLLTNNHVLSSARDASFSQVEFNFQDGTDGRPLPSSLFDLQPDLFFLTNVELDYSLVAVRERARSAGGDHGALDFFGWTRLIEEEGKAILGECLNIIQHPNGEPKQLALRENNFIDLLERFIHYETDTAPGSSGSPVFNDQWEVVGLHHSGVPRKDNRGNILTRDGAVWKPSMGEHRVDWVANEGVRVSRLIKHLKVQTLKDGQRRLRSDMFEKAPPLRPVTEMRQPSVKGADTPPESGRQPSAPSYATANGNAVWTIPLQVSVSLGPPAAFSAAHKTIPSANGNGMPASGDPITTATPSPSPVKAFATPLDNDEELREAIAELEAARTRDYYDEARDERDRNEYYGGLPASPGGADLFGRLNSLLTQTHANQPKYKPNVHVYPWVDLQPNLKLRSIYSAREFDPEEIIREDFRIDQERASRMRERMLVESTLSAERMAAELGLLEAALPYNCEHVVPQSWFEKREPMRGDLHHLFACESGCNSFRGNIPYFDFSDFEEAVREECGMRIGNRFEPTAGKGAVARAVLYFLLRYPGEINRTAREYEEDRLEVLLNWHRDNEVTIYERHRNMAIFEKQGNRNPLIDFPDWAGRIDFRRGLGD